MQMTVKMALSSDLMSTAPDCYKRAMLFCKLSLLSDLTCTAFDRYKRAMQFAFPQRYHALYKLRQRNLWVFYLMIGVGMSHKVRGRKLGKCQLHPLFSSPSWETFCLHKNRATIIELALPQTRSNHWNAYPKRVSSHHLLSFIERVCFFRHFYCCFYAFSFFP